MKVAVASCCKIQQIDPQPIWQEIMRESPDIVILVGDNIYLDQNLHDQPDELRSELQALYSAQLDEQYFSELLDDIERRGATLLVTYDDHDFLGDNRYGGDHDPVLRQAARDELIRAFRPPMTGADIYSLHQTDLVDTIVLDERFYRTAPTHSRDDPDALLGKVQWEWFEAAVKHSTAAYLLVASSSTYHSFGGECWEQYPAAFARMRRLMTGRTGAVIISGDAHRNAMYDDSGVMEIVTSGVSQKSMVFGTRRENYGIFTFDDHAMRAELRSLKAGSRFNVSIHLDNWQL